MKKDALIIVRGGGDLATGTIHRLWSAGLRVLVLETTRPAAIRRQVALCEAVYEGEATVEGLRAVRIEALEQAQSVWAQGAVPVLVDPEGACIARAKPEVVVDAILAKRNLGTRRDMAPLTIARPRLCSRAGRGRRSGDQARPPAGQDHPGGKRYPQYRHSRRHWRVRCRAGDPCTGRRCFYECA